MIDVVAALTIAQILITGALWWGGVVARDRARRWEAVARAYKRELDRRGPQ